MLKMTFEGIMMILALGVGTFMIAIPGWRLFRKLNPPKADPLGDAKVRLEVAKQEKEAAVLNKETEKLYDEMYHDVLEDDDTSDETKHTTRSKL